MLAWYIYNYVSYSMARIRIKIGQNEVEVDSRDFYVDNDTIHEVVRQVAKCVQDSDIKTSSKSGLTQKQQLQQGSLCNEISCALPLAPVLTPQTPEYLNSTGLENIREAEAFEPELSDTLVDTLDENYSGAGAVNHNDNDNADTHSNNILTHTQVVEGLLSLRDADKFFDSPRTVNDTVRKFWEYSWHASSLDIAKALAEMTLRKQITKNLSQDAPSTYVSPDVCCMYADMDDSSKQEESLFTSTTAV